MRPELYDTVGAAMSDFGKSYNIPIAYSWRNYAAEQKKAFGKKYLKCYIYESSPDVIGVCTGSAQYLWTFQVSVCVKEGLGDIVPLETVEILSRHFPVGFVFEAPGHEFKVIKPAEVIAVVNTGEILEYPVQFVIHTID